MPLSAPTSNASDGQRFWLAATRPSNSSARAARELHQSVRLLAPRAMDPARAVILEAPRDKVHAVREQGGGERVAGVAFVARAVELERQPPRAVDDPASGQAKRLRQGASPGEAAPGRALSWISCVRVSRRTRNHWRQPALCCQSSSCGPAGLSRV